MSLLTKDLPSDAQAVLVMLIEDVNEANSKLSPYAYGLYSHERIPQTISTFVEGSESLIAALKLAVQLIFPSSIVTNKSVLIDFKKTIYTNIHRTFDGLDIYYVALTKAKHPHEAMLITLIQNVLIVLTDNISLKQQSLSHDNLSTSSFMIPYHCELCHRLTTKRFCEIHEHGSSQRRKMEIKFNTFYQKNVQKSYFYRSSKVTTWVMHYSVWNYLSLNRLDLMKTIPPVSNQPILGMDWVKELPDTISKVSDCLYGPIENFGQALNDQSELWQSINAEHTAASYSEHEILISTLLRYQLYCDLKNFDLRETKRKLNPDEVLKLYDNGQGMKLVNIAKRFNVSPQAVSKLLKKYNYKSN